MTRPYPAARMLLTQLRRAGITPPARCTQGEALELLAGLGRAEAEERPGTMDEIAAELERRARG